MHPEWFWRNGWIPPLLFAVFLAGGALFWFTCLGRIRFTRMSRVGLWRGKRGRIPQSPVLRKREKAFDENPLRVRTFLERAKLAGLDESWTHSRFQAVQAIAAGLFGILALLYRVVPAAAAPGGGLPVKALLFAGLAALLGWWLPELALVGFASRARSRYLSEISMLAERLALCINENADLRDVLLRASRPLVLLRPCILELAAMWGKNQQEAIERFKDAVGITEVFPLVNALYALSRAETKDVVRVLREQAKSIEATLEADIARKIENAPIWISFYIMIPFACVVLLFLYPWLITVQTQLWSTYSIS